ncbi:MAG: serine/threonine protein phosphatase, partial [Epulopiscium sp.]|nr:serine/threonine protein phosphatase [Candidatus Epulonipiscium sp.]
KINHKELIKWLKNLPLYYETEKQIFVHAGIDEEAEDWWQHGTTEEIFTSKYPPSFGKFYKDIIAGHIATNSLKDEEGFHGVYFDGENHYYIDGTVEVSGCIPLLIYDDLKEKYIY